MTSNILPFGVDDVDFSRIDEFYTPDESLLRRYGLVRAVGGTGYIVAVAALWWIYGTGAWPLTIGIPILGVATFLYFMNCLYYPRTAVAATLLVDCLVLGGLAGAVGGTGAGTAALYTIPIVSAGIVLGPAASTLFTLLGLAFAWTQLGVEQLGYPPAYLYREDLSDRLIIVTMMSLVVAGVGYITTTYASRLQASVARAGIQAGAVRDRNERRRAFVRNAKDDTIEPLRQIGSVVAQLDETTKTEQERTLLQELHRSLDQLRGAVGQLADVGALDEVQERRPYAVSLENVAENAVEALTSQLHEHHVTVDVEPIRVLGRYRALYRVLYTLIHNIVVHTPPGTRVWVEARRTGGHGALIVTDDGPGVPEMLADTLFEPPAPGMLPRVGLSLAAELVEAMEGEISYHPREEGGAVFVVGLRLAPRDAPGIPTDEEREEE